ncbi:MAG: hypothetical protein IT432_12280 [Phycisphaerales bacterium]|nr:hypothetical protein [Phycisphaerales bacterium]
MTSVTPAPSPILTWPAERFYWATLPPGIIRRDGVLPPGALELVRDQVPVPLEQLHAVVGMTTRWTGEATGGGGGHNHALVCMIEREALQSLDPGALMLTPEAIPACVLPQAMDEPNPPRLNLLTGEFEPPAIRSHRRRRTAIVLGAIAISCVAVALDLSRRAEQLWRIARDDTAAARALLAQTSGSGVPDAIALERELEQLRAIASPAGHATSFDAPRALAEIVGAWPSLSGPGKPGPGESGAGNTGPGVEGALPQSLSVRPDASTLTVRTPGAPAAFLAAWKTPAGWTSAEPRVQSGVQSNAQGGAEGGLVTLELRQVTPSDTKGGGR